MRITVAITGASGAIYAQRLLLALESEPMVEKIYLLATDCGSAVWQHELPEVALPCSPKIERLDNNNFFNPIASGSNPADAMVVVPCSMGTIGRIASGVSSTLLERAADVQIKEGLPLILAFRESPLSLIHLENLTKLSRAGAILLPAAPSFYSLPTTIQEAVDTVTQRILDKVGIKKSHFFRWNQK